MAEENFAVRAHKVENLVAAIPPDDVVEEEEQSGKVKPRAEKIRDSVELTLPDNPALDAPIDLGDPVEPKGTKLGSSVVLAPPEESEEPQSTEPKQELQPSGEEETEQDSVEFNELVTKLKSLSYWQRQKKHIDKVEDIDILRRLAELWKQNKNLSKVIQDRIIALSE